MDTESVIKTVLHRESAHQLFTNATPAERLAAREHVKKFIADHDPGHRIEAA